MSDPYFANVSFLLGTEGADVADDSSLGQTVTKLGTAALSATQAKFGTNSLRCPDDTGVTVPDHASFLSGSGAFTIEGFFRFSALPSGEIYLAGQWDWNSVGSWALVFHNNDDDLYLYIDETGSNSVEGFPIWSNNDFALVVDTWYHLAIDFDGTTYRSYLDGVMKGEEIDSYSIYDSSVALCIGNNLSSGGALSGGNFDGYIDEFRLTKGVARYQGSFTVPTEAYPRTAGNDLEPVLTDGVAIDDGVADTGLFLDILTQSMTVAQTQTVTKMTFLSAADTTRLFAYVQGAHGHAEALGETIEISEALDGLVGLVVLERLGIAEAVLPGAISGAEASDTFSLSDVLRRALDGALADSVAVSLDLQASLAVRVLEALGIAPALQATLTYGRSIADTVQLVDALARVIGGDLTDNISITPEMLAAMRLAGLLADATDVSDTLDNMLLLAVIADDTVEVTATDAVQMLFAPTLAEEITLRAAYLTPDGASTWVMNARTGAVSEYDNFEFNSFASLGNKYLGASSSGLYELLGDDDDGTAIIPRLKGGFLQFGGTKLSRLKSAYIASRGDNDFVLKILTGEGTEYIYALSTRSMRSTKVHMGKGQRARYFAFELTGDGGDFDLDTLEFVPVTVDRRV